ncbi:MAG: nucleotidyl transferase AbiEii/AbiGii toxin family protein [Acidimicrobiia bacterium]|nr:nucleotidyl transferase AbiEii/AbiGii toxin family protein [Acidimicrobiia bacterium]
MLSRLPEIANDSYLGDELVFRGGTCLHKLHVGAALRYSEDLDYVRRSEGGIKPLTKALTELGKRGGEWTSGPRSGPTRRCSFGRPSSRVAAG